MNKFIVIYIYIYIYIYTYIYNLHTYFSKDKRQIGKNICKMLNVINIIQIKVHLYINKKGTQ